MGVCSNYMAEPLNGFGTAEQKVVKQYLNTFEYINDFDSSLNV